MAPLAEFTAHGSARPLSAAIEACAAERRLVNALVVPWESAATTIRMAVTSSKTDGWSIEHTNLGTIALDELGDGRTHIAVIAAAPAEAAAPPGDAAARDRQRALLMAFASQIRQKLGAQE
jgi:hypothetical protein